MRFFDVLSSCGVVGLVLASSVCAGETCDFFTDPVSYPTGPAPGAIAVDDLDGDRDLDIALAAFRGIAILKNNGDGTFTRAVNYSYASEGAANDIKLGDLDGDRDLDVAVVHGSSAVVIHKNNGDGTFEEGSPYLCGDGSLSIDLGDVDGDTDLDVLTANNDDDDATILKNNGDGTLAAPVHYPTGQNPFAARFADLDGDLDNDFMVTSLLDDNVSLFLNDGGGNFAFEASFFVGIQPVGLVLFDVEADGDVDAVVSLGNKVVVLLNNADGTFAAPVAYGLGGKAYSIAAADFDGDGDLDLATPGVILELPGQDDYSNGSLTVLLNIADGTFALTSVETVAFDSYAIAAGDLDQDGDSDLAVANFFSASFTSSAEIFLNDGIAGECESLFGDVTGNGVVDGEDLGLLLAAWASSDDAADLNDDGTVNGVDLGLLLANWTG
jgi:hypothetical protein